MIIFFQSNRFSISIILQMKQIFEHYSSSILHSFPHFIRTTISSSRKNVIILYSIRDDLSSAFVNADFILFRSVTGWY